VDERRRADDRIQALHSIASLGLHWPPHVPSGRPSSAGSARQPFPSSSPVTSYFPRCAP
jgi:hypothetical protein